MKSKKSAIIKSAFCILIITCLMCAFEMIKQFIFPQITIWESHTITITFVSFIIFCFAFLYFRNLLIIKHYKEALNKKTISQMN
jgi:hypothetical protein